MNTYRWVLFFHIASAAFLISGSVVGILVRTAVRRCATMQEGMVALAIGRPVSVMNPMSALTLLGTGIWLATLGRWWGTPWVLVALVLWVANVAVAKGVVGRVVGQLAGRLRGEGGPFDRETDAIRNSNRWTVGGNLIVAHDLAILLFMTLRLPLVPSLWVVALADGAAIALVGLRGLRARPTAMLPADTAPLG